MKLNPRSLLAAVVACSLALPGAAMADRRGHDRDYGHSYDRHSSRHYDRHYDRHYHHDHHDRVIRHYYKGRDDDDLLIGLVVGGVLGYALNGAQHTERYDTYYPEPRPYRNAYPATETYSYSDDSCLQEREYTTTVQIGGRNVEAYGTACLQPDGSWKRGPAEPVSY